MLRNFVHQVHFLGSYLINFVGVYLCLSGHTDALQTLAKCRKKIVKGFHKIIYWNVCCYVINSPNPCKPLASAQYDTVPNLYITKPHCYTHFKGTITLIIVSALWTQGILITEFKSNLSYNLWEGSRRPSYSSKFMSSNSGWAVLNKSWRRHQQPYTSTWLFSMPLSQCAATPLVFYTESSCVSMNGVNLYPHNCLHQTIIVSALPFRLA